MSKHERAVQSYNALVAHLEDKNFKIIRHDDDLRVVMIWSASDNMPVMSILAIDEDREILVMSSQLSAKMSEAKRMDGAMAIAMCNWAIMSGTLDYDISDGEIRYRWTQSFAESVLNDAQIYYQMGVMISTVARFNKPLYLLAEDLIDLPGFIDRISNRG